MFVRVLLTNLVEDRDDQREGETEKETATGRKEIYTGRMTEKDIYREKK